MPPAADNAFNEPRVRGQLESVRHLQLSEGQNFLLAPPSEDRRCLRLFFQRGVVRLAASFGEQYPDVTLAFCGDAQCSWLRLPVGTGCLLEVLKAASLELQYADHCPAEQDLVVQWLFDLHLVRHPVGAEARLVALLQLLVSRFGLRRADGYLLPFPLAHARMAELIGATRSTVTRQITLLRQQNDLQVSEPEGTLLLSAGLMEVGPAPRSRW